MTDFEFSASIDGQVIRCSVIAPIDMLAPIFCFSLMAPPVVIEGGTLVRSVGGYGEVALPELIAGQPCAFTLGYANDYRPVNRAWLPLGAYLRTGSQTYELPVLAAGVRPQKVSDVPEYEGLRLVPPPASWTAAGGVVRVSGFRSSADSLGPVDGLAQRCGIGGFLREDGLPLKLENDRDIEPEGYRLVISGDGAVLTSSDAAGIWNGAVTLMVLRAIYDGEIPCGQIEDTPRFAWRGQHLDCARHFYDVATILRLLDLMACLKLNRFHWHFSDDEAFRVEVECAPDLWKKTAFRGEGEVVPGVFGGGVRSGGSYSKADVERVVAHARALNIEVIPEIEVPAHALGLAAVVDGLLDPDDTGEERSVQGYAHNVVNPAMPATLPFLKTLADEIADMFPFGVLHLGCDELPPDTWAGSPAVARLKAKHGLNTRDDVQEYVMRQIAAHLTTRGVRPAAWEEAARGAMGGIGHDAMLFSWTGAEPGVAAARAGYDVVMCPAQHVYLDMAHSAEPDDWGAAWAAFVSLEDTINWDPVPEADINPRVIGVQGTFWSEFTTIDHQMEPMLAPRILGVATMAWATDKAITGEDLAALAGHYGALFDAMAWDRFGAPSGRD